MGKKGSQRHSSIANDTAYSVFLSHATHDKWIAQIIREKLEASSPRIKVWIDDRDIDGGDRIPDTILKAIEDCQEVVVLFTPASKDRTWVTIEIGAALGRYKRIVPLFYHIDPDAIVDVVKDRRGFHLNQLADYIVGLRSRAEGEVVDD